MTWKQVCDNKCSVSFIVKAWVAAVTVGWVAGNAGVPAGFMADCPGMSKNTSFSARTRDTLSVVVIKPSMGYIFNGDEKRCKLNRKGVACVANHLDFRKPTKVLISGYLDSSISVFLRTIAGIDLSNDRNVLLLEIFPHLWRTYPISARSTKPLGKSLGEFLARLSHKGLTPDHLEILGGSLGAHVGYFASMKFFELTGQKPARLTGLDPAGPCFRNRPPGQRFSPDGAVKVDAIHTNMDGFGIADPVAQVDFYAAGGEFQSSMVGNLLLPCLTLCSHVRAAIYWAYAGTNPDSFQAIRCNSMDEARKGDCHSTNLVTNLFGPKTNFSKPGIYYLPVSPTPPYYLGKEGLKQKQFGTNWFLTKITPDKDIEI